MPKRRLLWQLFPTLAALVLVAALVIGWIAVGQFQQISLEHAQSDLRGAAAFLDSQLGPEIPDDRTQLARMARIFDQETGIRVALLLPTGDVDSDSRDRGEEFESQLDRPEIERALAGQAQDSVLFNSALDSRVIYLAFPVLRHDKVFGVLYLSQSLSDLDRSIARVELWLVLASAALVGLSIAAAWRMAASVAQPVEQIRVAADRIALGQWNSRVPLADALELAEAGEAFNRMAETLQKQIGVLEHNNNEQQAVLASMAEGVLAVDSRERVISMNQASARLLGLDPAQAQGRSLREVVRNADLSRFISRALASPEPLEDDVLLLGERQRVLQARGSALRDLHSRPIGAVVVLNDVTDFRRLEDIRRDFVANVSHELKTPITSIKGFVETLLDGAINDPADAERFLRIVAKQADRLHAIIEDLLSLSKIEQSEDDQDIVLSPMRLRGVLESAVATCQTTAAERSIPIALACDENLQALINPVLLEQAVVNLLDNAMKYSDPGREVRVVAEETPSEILISVSDRGCGIAGEHLSRIFERFYRVDPARSRKLGGTGLGLAIVKHITQAHRGQVTVESLLGAGSTFTIHLPK